MHPPSNARIASWHCLFPVACLLCLPSCLLVVTSGPTTVESANIVFVATGDGGVRVSALLITVTDVRGDWHGAGRTSWDGLYRCDVPSGILRVRAVAAPPSGYVLAEPGAWPRELEVRSGETVEVEVRVTAGRQ